MTIWYIDIGLPGHTLQVETVCRMLEKRANACCHRIDGRLSVRGGLRGVTKRFIDFIPIRLIPAMMNMMYRGIALPPGMPDLILTSGSSSVPLCRLLKRLTGVPGVFLGELHPPRSNHFDLVVAPVTLGIPNEFFTPLTQTGRTAAQAASAAASFWPAGAPRNCWTMIIGGDGKSHRYTGEDWKSLADAMNAAAGKNGVRWLITTSRRTGVANEKILGDLLDPTLIADAIWWASAPRKGLMAMVHAGERVFATRDSLTMISEVIAAKERVEVVRPDRGLLPETSVYERYLKRLEQEGRLVCHSIRHLDIELPPLPSVTIAELQEAFENRLLKNLNSMMTKG